MGSGHPTQSLAASPWGPRKVLFVDHDCNDLRGGAEVLRQRGFHVNTCSCSEDGVQTLDREPFDFVLVCQGSPDFEGRPVLERAKSIDRQMPVLVVTRCPNMHCYLEAMQLGAFDYVEKPIAPSELARMVEKHLRPAAAAVHSGSRLT
jgi:DNA-binding response OmpR family regulator